MSRAVRESRRRIWEARQRADGREDAKLGRPAATNEPNYMRGYEGGSSACECANETAHPGGCERDPQPREKLCAFCEDGHNEKGE